MLSEVFSRGAPIVPIVAMIFLVVELPNSKRESWSGIPLCNWTYHTRPTGPRE